MISPEVVGPVVENLTTGVLPCLGVLTWGREPGRGKVDDLVRMYFSVYFSCLGFGPMFSLILLTSSTGNDLVPYFLYKF